MTLIARRWQSDRGGGGGLGVSGSDNNGNGKAQHNQLMDPMQQVFLTFAEIHNYQAHLMIHNLCSTGAFRDSGAGAGLSNFWKRWVRVRRDSAIKKYFYLYFLYIAKHIFSHYTNIYQI